MAKQKIEFTEVERNYINEQNTYFDDTKRVYLTANSNGYTVFAKPVQGSQRAYTFKEKNNFNAYMVTRVLMDKSIGYSFEVRNNRILCKPTTSKATLVIDAEEVNYAFALVKYLREQEVVNRRKYNATKGFSLVKKMINDNLTEEELYESLYGAIDDNIEEKGTVIIGNSIFFDSKTAKRKIAMDDFNKAVSKAAEDYQNKIDTIGY